MGIHNSARPSRAHKADRFCASADDQIATDQRITFTCGHANSRNIGWLFCNTAVDVNGATLLSEPGHLHHARAFAIQMRGHRHHGTNGHNARATNAGNDHIVGSVYGWQNRVR